jgi:nitroimidazol reductase NimA-like FMN-containing flavoprotein (pyridoxamine 5'-phosphate oxidase superfamily)
MAFVRVDESIYLHGSTRTRMLAKMVSREPVCATVTLLDGLVLARSAFHHSMNYRSVSVLGCGRGVDEDTRKTRILEALMQKIAPGRSAHIRGPNAQELKATAVVELPLEEVSGKVRVGPPLDDAEDLALDVWAGTLPLRVAARTPQPDAAVDPAIALPDHVRDLMERWS